MFILLWITSLSVIMSLVHPHCCEWHYFAIDVWLVFHWYISVHTTSSSIHLLRHLGCSHVLAVVNSATMNIGVHVSFWIRVLFRYMPRTRIAGSYDSSVSSLFFLRNLHTDGKEFTCNVADLASIPGLGRSPGEGNGSPLQYSVLENSVDCIVHGVAKGQTQLSDFHFHNASRILSFF